MAFKQKTPTGKVSGSSRRKPKVNLANTFTVGGSGSGKHKSSVTGGNPPMVPKSMGKG